MSRSRISLPIANNNYLDDYFQQRSVQLQTLSLTLPMPIQALYKVKSIPSRMIFLEVISTTNANLALCSLSAKMEEPMKEHHQIQSHMNALGVQSLRLTLQSGQMDDLNVCLDFQCLYA